MGKIFKSEDMLKGRRKMIEEATRDLSPGVRDAVVGILESWRGKESEEPLIKMLGE